MSIVQGTLPVGSLDHAITLNVQSSGGSHFETVTDTTPYLHRASPQDVASSMKLKKVVGGTIAWNQFNPNPKFEDGSTGYQAIGGTFTVADGVAQVVINTALHYYWECRIQRGLGTASIKGHRYLFSAEATLSVNGKVNAYIGQMSGTPATADVTANQYAELNTIYTCTTTNNGAISVATGSDFAQRQIGDILYVRKMCVYDLTQMFGSTIADYIYSLEQAHAGDGVAWFKALFPKAYYSYNAGELMSVQTSAHKTVGFNQWDEEWEQGMYRSNTTTVIKEPSNDHIRSKNPISVMPNTTYYMNSAGKSVHLIVADADGNVLYRSVSLNNGTFTTPANGVFAYFNMAMAYGTTYNNDICINLSSSRNGEYEPYEEHTYPLDDNLELRGIPKLDSNNELYYDGDTYASDGNVQRKYGTITFDGSSDESWILIAFGPNGYYRAYTSVNGIATTTPDASIGNIICNKFTPMAYSNGVTQTGVSCRSGYAQLNFFQTAITSVADWKTWLSNNPVTVVYELATSTTESADAYTQSQRVGATEEFVDGRTPEIPVGNVSEYKRLIQED